MCRRCQVYAIYFSGILKFRYLISTVNLLDAQYSIMQWKLGYLLVLLGEFKLS